MPPRPTEMTRNRGRWPSEINEFLAFVYTPGLWARRHRVLLTERVESLRRFVLGWLYHRAGVPILGPNDERITYPVKPIYGPDAPWVIHALDVGQGQYDPLVSEKRYKIAAGGPGIIETDRFLVFGRPYLHDKSDPPVLAKAMRIIEDQAEIAARLKWKVCKLCGRAFPAQRNAKACPSCLARLSRRQSHNRLSKSPENPVVFRYYDATRQPQFAFFELSPGLKPPRILLRYSVWAVGSVFTLKKS